jgi:hypothetical protein
MVQDSCRHSRTQRLIGRKSLFVNRRLTADGGPACLLKTGGDWQVMASEAFRNDMAASSSKVVRKAMAKASC